MADQRDMSEILRDFSHKKFVGSNYRDKMGALLRHFQEQGLTLLECTDKRRLDRALSTLKGYARENNLAFPDYVPRTTFMLKKDEADGSDVSAS